MSNNRTEQQALVSALAATVDLSELKAALVQAGYVFKKDVIDEVTAAAGEAIADFSANDQVIITTSGNVAITVTGLEDGQRAKLKVNKDAADNVSFSGIAGTIDGELNNKTVLYYDIININGFIVVYQLNSRQNSGSIAEGDITASIEGTGITIDSFDYFDYVKNNNMINITFSATFSHTAGAGDLSIGIAASRVLGKFKRIFPKSYAVAASAVFSTGERLSISGNIADTGTGYALTFKTSNGSPDEFPPQFALSFNANIPIQ